MSEPRPTCVDCGHRGSPSDPLFSTVTDKERAAGFVGAARCAACARKVGVKV